MKKILLILCLFMFLSCKDKTPKAPEPVSPFKSGDIVYLKIDTTQALIKFEVGSFDTENFIYRIVYKDKNGDKKKEFALSSELFKKE